VSLISSMESPLLDSDWHVNKVIKALFAWISWCNKLHIELLREQLKNLYITRLVVWKLSSWSPNIVVYCTFLTHRKNALDHSATLPVESYFRVVLKKYVHSLSFRDNLLISFTGALDRSATLPDMEAQEYRNQFALK